MYRLVQKHRDTRLIFEDNSSGSFKPHMKGTTACGRRTVVWSGSRRVLIMQFLSPSDDATRTVKDRFKPHTRAMSAHDILGYSTYLEEITYRSRLFPGKANYAWKPDHGIPRQVDLCRPTKYCTSSTTGSHVQYLHDAWHLRKTKWYTLNKIVFKRAMGNWDCLMSTRRGCMTAVKLTNGKTLLPFTKMCRNP